MGSRVHSLVAEQRGSAVHGKQSALTCCRAVRQCSAWEAECTHLLQSSEAVQCMGSRVHSPVAEQRGSAVHGKQSALTCCRAVRQCSAWEAECTHLLQSSEAVQCMGSRVHSPVAEQRGSAVHGKQSALTCCRAVRQCSAWEAECSHLLQSSEAVQCMGSRVHSPVAEQRGSAVHGKQSALTCCRAARQCSAAREAGPLVLVSILAGI